MSRPLIRIEQLSKRFRCAPGARRHGTLRDRIAASVTRAWRPKPESPHTAGFWALRDINIEVHAGEVCGLIGHNGSGKSTLLKILARITAPTAGYAIVAGRVGAMLEIGTGFHMELSGRENVFLSGAILGMRRNEIRRRFDEIVDFSGVAQFLDLPVKRYSSGMYLRLAFAVACHLESQCLLLDEVLAVGDAEFQARCLNKIRQLAGDGRAIVLVSHDHQALRAICDSAVLLEAGRVKSRGPARDFTALTQAA